MRSAHYPTVYRMFFNVNSCALVGSDADGESIQFNSIHFSISGALVGSDGDKIPDVIDLVEGTLIGERYGVVSPVRRWNEYVKQIGAHAACELKLGDQLLSFNGYTEWGL